MAKPRTLKGAGKPMPALMKRLTEQEMDDLIARIPAERAERVEFLQRLLGEGACRQLGIFPIPEGFKLSVVIPVYNEQDWIRELVRRVEAVPIPKEIIIV